MDSAGFDIIGHSINVNDSALNFRAQGFLPPGAQVTGVYGEWTNPGATNMQPTYNVGLIHIFDGAIGGPYVTRDFIICGIHGYPTANCLMYVGQVVPRQSTLGPMQTITDQHGLVQQVHPHIGYEVNMEPVFVFEESTN